ncbi:MAG: DUF3883 domain-containing protein [Thaumarchaeota archaeon]|nr:DUF3883 domain-containing protein [Nitrososphaerota archaeon]
MKTLDEIKPGTYVKGLLPDSIVNIIDVKRHGSEVVEITYKDATGKLGNELVYEDRAEQLEITNRERPWNFDADGRFFRLVSEAYRIKLAYTFDSRLAVHISLVVPLPHQITAVYEKMLPRQPLRYLLADDPGAGKTIMTGLLIKEMMLREDVKRCLICCPGNLAEQWQEEMYSKFHLKFDIITNERIETSLSGNPYQENNLVISRLDQMSRNLNIQAKLEQTSWDLIVCDEAHKMSAHVFANELKETKRYKLGKLLSSLTRNFLLLTATPHNGKEEDFQAFMSLLDADRFEGRYREDVHRTDASDLMRRLEKEQMFKFDGTRLFPERFAHTVQYFLSPDEQNLYNIVTDYVRNEMNRADRLEEGRRNVVGFALTILQRRLASSPEAIYSSIRRRRERLEKKLKEEKGDTKDSSVSEKEIEPLTEEEIEDIEDAPDEEKELAEEQIVDQASAAQNAQELALEIETLKELEQLALNVRNKGQDKKWETLSELLQEQSEMFDAHGFRRKLIIFTEHLDTLKYLENRIRGLIGKKEAVVSIHGALRRDERKRIQEAFVQEKEVEILVATDAAGEGINLQRANLMVNYDMPWNPNRLEQRFGRIHRIGQTEVCHLWNLVAKDTREGDVLARVSEKLEIESLALGGRVFDIIGEIFEGISLKDLIIEAIRYNERPDVKAKLYEKIDNAIDKDRIIELLERHALTRDSMDAKEIQRIREEMERAEAKRLQPHFICAFFMEALKLLGGTIKERESKRYEITYVPAIIRNRGSKHGLREVILSKYERITFEKELINLQGKPTAEFVAPGHPLLDTTIDLILEKYGSLLKQGSVLVDPTDSHKEPRVLFYLENTIQDARKDNSGNPRIISKELHFVEIKENGEPHSAGYAPYLDYRPINDDELSIIKDTLSSAWIQKGLEEEANSYANRILARKHFEEVKIFKEEIIQKIKAAVQDRLTKQIIYWNKKADELKEQELEGKVNARLNSGKARQRADELMERLKGRMLELEQEKNLRPGPSIVIGGSLIIPFGLLISLGMKNDTEFAVETDEVERLAMEAVIDTERNLGRIPSDVSADNSYDVESKIPGTGKLKFIEVKGRLKGKKTVTVTKNEILTCLNKPDDFILAIVLIENGKAEKPKYIFKPFEKEPEFAETSRNYDLEKLLDTSEDPR